jgi:hypothetical protein
MIGRLSQVTTHKKILFLIQKLITLRTINNVQKVQEENHQLMHIGWFGLRICREGEERSAPTPILQMILNQPWVNYLGERN